MVFFSALEFITHFVRQENLLDSFQARTMNYFSLISRYCGQKYGIFPGTPYLINTFWRYTSLR
jgi:hypothetical protein